MILRNCKHTLLRIEESLEPRISSQIVHIYRCTIDNWMRREKKNLLKEKNIKQKFQIVEF